MLFLTNQGIICYPPFLGQNPIYVTQEIILLLCLQVMIYMFVFEVLICFIRLLDPNVVSVTFITREGIIRSYSVVNKNVTLLKDSQYRTNRYRISVTFCFRPRCPTSSNLLD